MKKVLLLASVAVLALSSCKKERSCTCKNDDGKEYTTVYENISKADAKDACLGLTKQTKSNGEEVKDSKFTNSYGGTSDCELK